MRPSQKLLIMSLLVLLIGVLITSCGFIIDRIASPFQVLPSSGNIISQDLANGERIYFTASNSQGNQIHYSSGPNFGGMMMGTYLTCASCHGPTGRGGVHMMHMQVMDAPDIRYKALVEELEEHSEEHGDEHDNEHIEYDLDTFRMAVIEGLHPDGDPLVRDMPRCRMSDQDLADLYEFIKSLP